MLSRFTSAYNSILLYYVRRGKDFKPTLRCVLTRKGETQDYGNTVPWNE